MRKLDPKKHPKLIKALNVTAQVLKIVAICCFSAVIVLFAVMCVFNDGSSSAGSGYISAKADEGVAETALSGDEMNASINDFDITNYPTANLINFCSFSGKENFYSLSVKQCTDGTFLVDGTIVYQEDGRAFKQIGTVTLSPGIYTLSGAPTGYSGMTGLVLANIGTDTGNGLTFTISSTQTIILYIAIAHDMIFDNVIWSPMLNSGSVAYPYIPPLDFVYDAGYSAGYEEANELNKYGFLVDSTVKSTVPASYLIYDASGTLTDIATTNISYSGSLRLSDGGFDLSQVYNYFETNKPDNFYAYTSDWSLNINFGTPVMVNVLEKNYYFRQNVSLITSLDVLICENFDGSGNVYRTSIYPTVIDTKKPYEVSFDISTSGLPSTITDIGDFYVLGFESSDISFAFFTDLPYFSLYVENPVFASGYNQGYNEGMVSGQAYKDGYDTGYTDGRTNGYDTGYTDGKTVGYDLGLSDGFQEGFNQTKSGGFTWLISSVQSFLDTSFFGDFGIGTLLYVGLGLILVTLFLKMIG